MNLNSAETICNTLKQTQGPEAVPATEGDLWKKLLEAWVQITPDTLTKLTAKISRLCAAVIKIKGGNNDPVDITTKPEPKGDSDDDILLPILREMAVSG
ncbi:hypothetical protein Trydic_g7047 [Trypoxylus dichotomus]